MNGYVVLLSRDLVGFRGSPEEFRQALWDIARDAAEGHVYSFALVQAVHNGARFAYLEPLTDPPHEEFQDVLNRAAVWLRTQKLWDRCVRFLREESERPKPSVLDRPYPFLKGSTFGDTSPDALMVLYEKGSWMWPRTREDVGHAIEHYLANPGKVRMPFGKHEGTRLADLPLANVVFLAERFDWQEPDSVLALAVREEYARRLVPHRTDDGTVVWDLPLRDEPGDSRGFIPGENLMGDGRKKPSGWTSRRPPAQLVLEDDTKALPPLPVLKARAERNKVYWATVHGSPELKSMKDDPGRVRAYDRALEALDLVAASADEEELVLRYRQARVLVDALALSEGWDPDDNPILDDLDEAYRRREEEFREVDWEGPRLDDALRRLRGCRCEEDLCDAALWINVHKDLFTNETLSRLRAAFSRHKARLTARHEPLTA